jgi:DNA-binding NarL/FixJ family response regulator
MNLLLIDHHTMFRSGLRFLLAEIDAGVRVLEAGSCAEARGYRDEPIDLVLLGLSLPGLSGEAAIADVRAAFASATQIVLSGEDDPCLVRRSIAAGAAGFIPKSSSPAAFADALRRVLAGGTYLPPQALRGRAAAGTRPLSAVVDGLSARQSEVFSRAVQGLTRDAIAREFELSEDAVDEALSVVLRALGVADRTEAVYATARLGVSAPVRAPAHAR